MLKVGFLDELRFAYILKSYMKNKIFTLILLILTSFCNAQKTKINSFDCINVPIKIIKIDNIKVKYKLVSVFKLYTKGKTDYYVAHCILPDYNESEKHFLQKIVNSIAKQNLKINEIAFFKNCETEMAFYSSTYTKETKKLIKENYIGSYKPKNKKLNHH